MGKAYRLPPKAVGKSSSDNVCTRWNSGPAHNRSFPLLSSPTEAAYARGLALEVEFQAVRHVSPQLSVLGQLAPWLTRGL